MQKGPINRMPLSKYKNLIQVKGGVMVGSNTVTPDNSIHHIYYNRPIMTILGRLGVSQPPRMQEMEWRMDLRGSTSR
jgi:hypothetical protein